MEMLSILILTFIMVMVFIGILHRNHVRIVDIHENRRTYPLFPERPHDARFPATLVMMEKECVGLNSTLTLSPSQPTRPMPKHLKVRLHLSNRHPRILCCLAGVGMTGDPTSHQMRTPEGIFQTVQRIKDLAVSHSNGRLWSWVAVVMSVLT